MNDEKLSGLGTVISDAYNNIAGIVIVKDNQTVYENYFDGYGPDDSVHVASVTKSILSALIGIAVKQGYIGNADQSVLDFFPEYVSEDAESKRQITIRHLLTMTAPYSYEAEPFQELCCSPDWVRFALDLLDGDGAIGTFKYSTAGAHLLSAIITRSTGRPAVEFANENLFQPLGMKAIHSCEVTAETFMEFLTGRHICGWAVDPKGNNAGGWGLTLTPGHMAQFGLLYLNKGIARGKQIIDPLWIEESIRINDLHYGYLWWLFDEEDFKAYCALGDGGNVICCLPQQQAVIAIASRFVPEPADRLKLIKEWILPAMKD